MRQQTRSSKEPAEKVVQDIRRATRKQYVDAVHFPQTGMISLIVEMPEDGSIEVGTVGREGGIGSVRHKWHLAQDADEWR